MNMSGTRIPLSCLTAKLYPFTNLSFAPGFWWSMMKHRLQTQLQPSFP